MYIHSHKKNAAAASKWLGGMHCNTLQKTATHCNALQLTASFRSCLQLTATIEMLQLLASGLAARTTTQCTTM